MRRGGVGVGQEILLLLLGLFLVLTSKVGGSVTSTATTTYKSGLVTQVSTAITGATTVPIAYQYDGFMRVKTRTIGGAVPIASTWDSSTGLLTATGGVGITRTGLVGGFQSGQLAGLTASGGRTYTVTYPVEPVTLKGYGEPQKLEAKFGATSKYSVTLGRDPIGRITTRQEVNDTTSKNRFYVYNAAGRLWMVYDGTDANGVLLATYTYDSNGNRTDQAYTYDLHDRQTSFGSASYAYTANGERTTRSTPAQTLTYDPQGQLVSVDAAGTVIAYEVDGLGRRVKRTKAGVSERYLWDSSRIAAVLDNAGAVLRRFVYATSGYVPDAILEGSAGTLYLVVKDERGSVRQLIDPAGLVAEKYEYDEWGKELPGAPAVRKSLFGFAGGVYDPDTGLVRFGARDYDPALGRWTTKDAIRFTGGWNLYGYCNADPINCVDPSGLDGNEYEWWLSQEGTRRGRGSLGASPGSAPSLAGCSRRRRLLRSAAPLARGSLVYSVAAASWRLARATTPLGAFRAPRPRNLPTRAAARPRVYLSVQTNQRWCRWRRRRRRRG